MTRSEDIPASHELEHAAAVLRVLADRTRLSILLLLDGRELTVTEIADQLGRSMPATSQHLAKLRVHKLVSWRREGTTIYYSQPDEHVAALVTNILQHSEHTLYLEPPHHQKST